MAAGARSHHSCGPPQSQRLSMVSPGWTVRVRGRWPPQQRGSRTIDSTHRSLGSRFGSLGGRVLKKATELFARPGARRNCTIAPGTTGEIVLSEQYNFSSAAPSLAHSGKMLHVQHWESNPGPSAADARDASTRWSPTVAPARLAGVTAAVSRQPEEIALCTGMGS